MIKTKSITLKEANEYVAMHHRHHKPVIRDKFRVAAVNGDGIICGVVQVARPVSRHLDDGDTCEVVRLVTTAEKNVCSFLYARAAEAAKALGYAKIITYILESEPGTSLKAAGWKKESKVTGKSWNTPSRPRQPNLIANKTRWSRHLTQGGAAPAAEVCPSDPPDQSDLSDVSDKGIKPCSTCPA